MSSTRSSCLAFLLGSALLPLAGCSGGFDYGDTGKIKGRLTMEGKPLEAGTGVSFMEPIKGFLAFGMTDANGDFTVDSWNNGNMPLGTYRVWVTPPPSAAPAKELTPEERFDHPELVEPRAKLEFPKKYADAKSSGLEFEVKKGDNVFNVDLQAAKAGAKPKG